MDTSRPLIPPLVHVIILNWNALRETLASVAALRAQDYSNLRVVVVDNGSDHASVESLRRASAGFDLVCNGRNLGFAGGCNAGMVHALRAGADYVWLLNSDADAPPDTLSRLVAMAEADLRIGLVSPLLIDVERPHNVSHFCGVFNRKTFAYEYTADVETGRKWASERPADVTLMGTALLIRRRVLEQVGLLDENLFAYWEDTDYSIRAGNAGLLNGIAFDVSVRHPNRRPYAQPGTIPAYYLYYLSRNEILLLRKHGKGLQKLRAMRWLIDHQLRVIERLGTDSASIQAVLAGMWDGWMGRGGVHRSDRRMPRFPGSLIARYPAMLRRALG